MFFFFIKELQFWKVSSPHKINVIKITMVPCLYHLTEILKCPACTILQRFYNALLIPIYRDFTMPCLSHFKKTLQVPCYRDFITINVNLQRFFRVFWYVCKIFSLRTSKRRIYRLLRNILDSINI